MKRKKRPARLAGPMLILGFTAISMLLARFLEPHPPRARIERRIAQASLDSFSSRNPNLPDECRNGEIQELYDAGRIHSIDLLRSQIVARGTERHREDTELATRGPRDLAIFFLKNRCVPLLNQLNDATAARYTIPIGRVAPFPYRSSTRRGYCGVEPTDAGCDQPIPRDRAAFVRIDQSHAPEEFRELLHEIRRVDLAELPGEASGTFAFVATDTPMYEPAIKVRVYRWSSELERLFGMGLRRHVRDAYLSYVYFEAPRATVIDELGESGRWTQHVIEDEGGYTELSRTTIESLRMHFHSAILQNTGPWATRFGVDGWIRDMPHPYGAALADLLESRAQTLLNYWRLSQSEASLRSIFSTTSPWLDVASDRVFLEQIESASRSLLSGDALEAVHERDQERDRAHERELELERSSRFPRPHASDSASRGSGLREVPSWVPGRLGYTVRQFYALADEISAVVIQMASAVIADPGSDENASTRLLIAASYWWAARNIQIQMGCSAVSSARSPSRSPIRPLVSQSSLQSCRRIYQMNAVRTLNRLSGETQGVHLSDPAWVLAYALGSRLERADAFTRMLTQLRNQASTGNALTRADLTGIVREWAQTRDELARSVVLTWNGPQPMSDEDRQALTRFEQRCRRFLSAVVTDPRFGSIASRDRTELSTLLAR